MMNKFSKNKDTKSSSNTSKTLALTGGGTMGHISPHIALLPELKTRFSKIIYIGSQNSMEEKKAKEFGLPFFAVPTVKFDRKHILKNLKIPFVLLKAKRQAKQILKKENVDILFSKGGYVSVPVILSAQKLNIPNVLHESDMSLGLANKVSAKRANKVFVSTEKAFFNLSKKLQAKATVTGVPVSDSFKKEKNLPTFSEKLKKQSKKKIMLVTGGSQGASAINNVIQQNLDELLKDYEIYHIVGTGKANKSIKKTGYHQLEFVSNMSEYMLASDVIISRGGATTIFEGLKAEANMILIPLPKSGSSRGDQVENAKYFMRLGLLDYIPQEKLTRETLLLALHSAEKQKEKRLNNIKKFNKTLPSNAEIAEKIANLTK